MAARVAVIGSGNIGTDLMMKIIKTSSVLEISALVGIDESSDGLARARRHGVEAIHTGVEGLIAHPDFAEVAVVFDATSASAHKANYAILRDHGVKIIDLTPAALGPYVIPPVNLAANLHQDNVNMVTCGGQATIPIVAAISSTTTVRYAEIVASIASRSAGPGTRANIDEFTETTARAIEQVGGATRGKAIIILNPAEPPMIMRDTVMCLVDRVDREAITAAVEEMVAKVQHYVPGYRLKQDVQFRDLQADSPEMSLVPEAAEGEKTVVSVLLEVEGAGHYLPAYAGNLDIMTSAAVRVGEQMVAGVQK